MLLNTCNAITDEDDNGDGFEEEDVHLTIVVPAPAPAPMPLCWKEEGLAGLGWRKHGIASGDGGGRSGRQGRTEGQRRASLSPSPPPTPCPCILVVGVEGGGGLQGEAARRGLQGDGWCLLTSPPRQRSTRGSNRRRPRHRRRGEAVEDDDNNADNTKSGFVDLHAAHLFVSRLEI